MVVGMGTETGERNVGWRCDPRGGSGVRGSRPDQACQGERPEMVACRDEILGLAASIHAAEAELIAKIAEFDAGEGWAGSGVRSMAHWLTLTCGFTATEARVRADASKRAGELPALFGAFGTGAFSVGALWCAQKVATCTNDAEVTRVALVATAPQASRTYAAFRKAVSAEHRREERLAERDRSEATDDSGAQQQLSPGADDLDSSDRGDPDTWMRMWWDEYQYLRIDGRLDTTDGAAFKAVLDAIRNDAQTNNHTPGEDTPTDTDPSENTTTDRAGGADGAGGDRADRAGGDGWGGGSAVSGDPTDCTRSQPALSWIDALARLIRLAGDALVCSGVRGRWQDRFAVSVTIDAEVLLGLNNGCGTLDDGAAVNPETVCDWLPAATLEGLITHRGAPLHMGRKVRVANRQTRRALKIRDGGCAFPGCGCIEFLEAHHLHGWANGALTDIDQLVLLCRRHHRLLHQGEYTITMVDHRPRFHSDVLGTGLPPPIPLTNRHPRDGAQSPSPAATKRSCEPLTHYAKDTLVALLFGTPQNRSQTIQALQ